MNFDVIKVAEVLGGEVSGGQVLAPGPGHSAADRSMSVKVDPAAPDGFLVHSFAGDDDIACRDYVRHKLGLPKPGKKPGKKTGNGEDGGPWKLIREHIYRTADGAPYLRKRKMQRPDGVMEFPQARWDGERWINKVPKNWSKILYRLPDLLKAPLTSIVYVTEGERDADTLAALSFIATTAGGVSTTWTPELAEMLRDRRVVICVDSDEPGRAYGEKVARALDKVAASVKVVDLFPEDRAEKQGRDVTDFIATDRAGVKFIKAVNDALEWEPSAPSPDDETKVADGEDDDASFDAEVVRLAKLPLRQYERERKKAAEKLKVRASVLDKLVEGERVKLGLVDDEDDKQGRAISFPEIEPWPEAVDGAELLDGLADAIRAHVVMTDQCRDTAALWVVHACLLHVFSISPRLAILSPTRGCGKSTLKDILSRFVPKPLKADNISAAAVYRVIEAYQPTLLIDEADTFIGTREELRGVFNSGHRRGECVIRTVGDDHEPRAFSTYAPCAIALIGRLHPTLADRSVTVSLKRRLPSEKIKRLRLDRVDPAHEQLARKIARWTKDNAIAIGAADPEMTDINRGADNWRPLVAIADIAGGEWPERARKAASADREAAADDDNKSKLERLVSDLRKVWLAQKVDRLPSAAIIAGLVGLPESPWAEHGKTQKPISQVQLARLLKPLGIGPQKIRIGEEVTRGYFRSQFEEAFQRYGSYASSSQEGDLKWNSGTNPDEMGISDIFQGGTDETGVPPRKSEKSNNDGLCTGVPPWEGGSGEKDIEKPSRGTKRPSADPPDTSGLPPGVKIIGRAPAGERCDLCGKSSDVLIIRQPGGGPDLHIHRHCAAKAKVIKSDR